MEEIDEASKLLVVEVPNSSTSHPSLSTMVSLVVLNLHETSLSELFGFVGGRCSSTFFSLYFVHIWTNSFKRKITTFTPKLGETLYQCWERYNELLNSCPHHGFETRRLVSHFYEGLTPQCRKMVEMMCNGECSDKDPKEALEFLDLMAKNAQNWDTTGNHEAPSKAQLSTSSGGMYNLKEEDDLQARFASLARKVKALEQKKSGHLKSIQEIRNDNYAQSSQPPPQTHQNFQNSQGYAPYVPPPRKNLEETLHSFIEKQESINNQDTQTLTDLKDTLAKFAFAITIHEKGKFLSQPQPNLKGQYNLEDGSSGNQHMDQVKSVITFRNGKVVEKHILEPCEKDDESVSKGKEGVDEPTLSKEKTKFPLAPPFPHAMNNQKKLNHNSEIYEMFKQFFKDEGFEEATTNLGKVLAEKRMHLVYRGDNLGLMGCVSKAAHEGRSSVLGIIPKALASCDIIRDTVGEVKFVSTMHERKAKILDHADAFIVLPGGLGTLEELFKVTSWA
ncbi:hypothetical protein QYF36_025237 [Acer negundo]|nr:hypothetical protein QYF36_025237 [Acer negundo]